LLFKSYFFTIFNNIVFPFETPAGKKKETRENVEYSVDSEFAAPRGNNNDNNRNN
jgi:hypothetical protein